MPWYAKKVGPLPVGAYVVAGIGAVGIGLYRRSHGGGGTLPDQPTSDEASLPFSTGPGVSFPPTFEAPPSVAPGIKVTPPPGTIAHDSGPLATPTGFRIVSRTPVAVTWSWKPVPGATSYLVRRNDGSTATVNVPIRVSPTHPGGKATYTYTVQAKGLGRTSSAVSQGFVIDHL